MAKRGRSRRNRTKTRTKSKITTSCQDTTMTEASNEPAKSTTNKSPDICQSGAVDGLTFPSPKDMKKDPFDELLGSHCDELYLDHDAVKVTYTNRKQKNNSNKSNTEYHDEVVHFRDNKNRDMILKWLNDSQNVFDRLTQTQEPASQRRIDDVWMEDMPPSVSQNLPKHSPKIQQKLNKCKQKGQCRKNTTSKPRAKSLDIVITKQNRGRVKRHSITIDLRSSKNDNIDNNTNNNNNGNVRTILLKMAEEEYLNSLDEELKDYKNGWDRMEKIKKTLRRTTRNKAQLDITLHNTPQQRLQQNSIKKNDNILDNLTKEEIMNLNYPVFNVDEFEDFVGKNMEETPANLSGSSNCCGYHNGDIQIEYNSDDSNLKIVEKCKDFIILLENLQINELTQLQEYYRRIETIFNKITQKSNKETQHPPTSLIDDEVETIVEEIIKKSVDSSKSFTNIGIQTDFQEITQKFNIDVEIQTVIEPKCDKSIQSSLKLLVDVGMQTMNVGEFEQVPDGEEESKIEDFQDSQLLHCFNFETEDFLKGSQTVIEKKIVEKPAIIEENHVNTPSDNNELTESATKQPDSQNRGTKRQSDQDIDEDNCNKKQRPCEKFIPDDLSIEFADTENIDKIVDTTVVNNDNNVNNQRTRTQELIEECDFLIQNVTKQKLQKNDDKHKTDTDEVFEENSMFINEENMSKINKDIDLFEANSSQDDNNSNKENIEKTPAKTRNNSRKNLFGKDEDTDEILISSNKINILENITLKNPNDEDDDDVIIIGSQNDDIIETTPQKNLSIYEKRSSFLDITLPPPLEFQDNEEKSSSFNRNINNKKYRHSTPNSNKFSSDFISLSPITLEKNPLELAQQSFQSLTIHMRPVTPSNRQHSQTKQRSILNYLSHSSRSQSQEIPLTPSQKPCIACTRINNDQLLLITALTNKKLATYSSTFTQKVTHMIVSVDDSNCVKDHTIKYVSAVAAGIWVLNIQWIQECLTKNCIVPEEEFEVLDLSGIDGPKQSRLKHATQPLLKNYKIYAAQPFLSTTQHDVENIVKLVGGKIVTHPESFLNKDGSICVIITEAKDTQDTNLYESWLEMFKVITVDIEWLSRSVGQYRVLSLRPFSLCSEDSILSLEYPKELLAEVPFSFSQDTYPVPIN